MLRSKSGLRNRARSSWGELSDIQAYQVELNGQKYTVEVQLLENTGEYVHVSVDVDDGSLPASFRPLSASFIRQKQVSG
jgi:hypothetical protein